MVSLKRGKRQELSNKKKKEMLASDCGFLQLRDAVAALPGTVCLLDEPVLFPLQKEWISCFDFSGWTKGWKQWKKDPYSNFRLKTDDKTDHACYINAVSFTTVSTLHLDNSGQPGWLYLLKKDFFFSFQHFSYRTSRSAGWCSSILSYLWNGGCPF